MADLWQSLLPAATLALGAVGTLVAEALRDRRQRKREDERSRDERALGRSDRRDEFELSVLRDSFDALDRLGRAFTVYHLLDVKAARSHGGLYASTQTIGIAGAEEGDQELLAAHRDLHSKALLILHEPIRDSVFAATAAVSAVSAQPPKTIKVAEALWDEAVEKIHAAQGALAERIRTLYSEA
jgi:hypothetical protein